MPRSSPPELRKLLSAAFPFDGTGPDRVIARAAKALGIRRQTLYAAIEINQIRPERAVDLIKASRGKIEPKDVLPFLDQSVLAAYQYLLDRPAR